MTTKPENFRFDGDSVTLPDGFRLVFTSEHDSVASAPWDECDGHGPVSEWTSRDKRSGEWLLCSDGRVRRYYDAAEANRIAKRDGWGLAPEGVDRLALRIGRAPTKGEIRTGAVRKDFEYLQNWCEDRWHYVGVIVTLFDPEGEEVDSRSSWCVESCGDYYRTVASGLADELIASHEKEVTEAASYAARC